MRICIIGKFPPIQGGVSMRTYRTAHALAAAGHDVHVVTNAKEARPPFRMYMRAEDWTRCEAEYGAGSVTVHWSDPADRSQSYIPMASPFVSKLAAIAARKHSETPFDVIYSHYLEPYGVAAHLAAQMTSVPHVARMAGSDAGRLWHHPQLEPLYDHILQSAEIVIAAGQVAERAVAHGVAADRVIPGGPFMVPEDLFTPDGPLLDLAALRAAVAADDDFRDLIWGEFAGDRLYFGVCGKLGESKGSFALLAAMQQLKAAGLDVGLVALAHGPRDVEKKFRSRARKLGLGDRILQIPFLPHWRVPEFLRGCLAVCCLEQDFPIGFHSPIIPLETLLCGSCLVASTEVIRKLPLYGRLAHGYGCIAIENVKNVGVLSKQLAAIARDPQPADAVGARGCRFARELQASVQFPQTLERILEHAAARKRMPSTVLGTSRAGEADDNRFFLTRLAAAAIQDPAQNAAADTTISRPVIDLSRAREIKAAIAKRTAASGATLAALIPAIEVEIAIATAEDEAASAADVSDPLFRLRISRWAMAENDLDRLVPLRDPSLRVLEFDYDVAEFMDVRTIEDLPAPPTRRPSHMVVFGSATDEPRMPLVVDGLTARILDLSDGSRTVSEIVKELGRQVGPSEEQDNVKWLERIFVHGLISLQEARIGGASGDILDQIDLDRRHRGPPRARAVRPTRS